MGGLVAGINLTRLLQGQPPLVMPQTTMIGALLHYITHAEPEDFQPMKANMGLLPELNKRIRSKIERYAAYATRAETDLTTYLRQSAFQKLEIPDTMAIA